MNTAQIDRLLDSVPSATPDRARQRVDGYARAARRCDERVTALRKEVADAISTAGASEDPVAADAVLDAMVQLEALERVQLRVDANLRASAGALAEQDFPAPVGEGPV